MNTKSNLIVGIILIIIGIILLLPQFIDIKLWDIQRYSPLAVSLLGIIFLITYFFSETKPSGMFFTGCLLFLLGMITFYSSIAGWHKWAYMAPAPVYAAALSLYMTYLIDRKHSTDLYVASIIIGAVSILSFFVLAIIFNKTQYLGLSLIISGVLLPASSLIRKKDKINKNKMPASVKGKKI